MRDTIPNDGPERLERVVRNIFPDSSEGEAKMLTGVMMAALRYRSLLDRLTKAEQENERLQGVSKANDRLREQIGACLLAKDRSDARLTEAEAILRGCQNCEVCESWGRARAYFDKQEDR